MALSIERPHLYLLEEGEREIRQQHRAPLPAERPPLLSLLLPDDLALLAVALSAVVVGCNWYPSPAERSLQVPERKGCVGPGRTQRYHFPDAFEDLLGEGVGWDRVEVGG